MIERTSGCLCVDVRFRLTGDLPNCSFLHPTIWAIAQSHISPSLVREAGTTARSYGPAFGHAERQRPGYRLAFD
jgi:hypothetical protein